jgi:hypothetical protein
MIIVDLIIEKTESARFEGNGIWWARFINELRFWYYEHVISVKIIGRFTQLASGRYGKAPDSYCVLGADIRAVTARNASALIDTYRIMYTFTVMPLGHLQDVLRAHLDTLFTASTALNINLGFSSCHPVFPLYILCLSITSVSLYSIITNGKCNCQEI